LLVNPENPSYDRWPPGGVLLAAWFMHCSTIDRRSGTGAARDVRWKHSASYLLNIATDYALLMMGLGWWSWKATTSG
jgi:hypothetical protein